MNNSSISRLRDEWAEVAVRLARPVLTNLAARTLRQNMPVEKPPGTDREVVTHLEALGRLLCGIAPWLECGDAEAKPWAALACEAIDAATDPTSPDRCNFGTHAQSLVDAAFLAQALLRAPVALWQPLGDHVKTNVKACLKATRVIQPARNNWLLFSGMIETALFAFGESDWDRMRIDYAFQQHEQWYKGDGMYGDGPQFHADYYNAFVIQPMLVDMIRHLRGQGGWVSLEERIMTRARRHAAIQERLISPEGTFPPLGRSLAYRFGALQGLAQMALLHELPAEVSPAQVREAMTAVIRRSMSTPGTFDAKGWLRIGFCGAQSGIGEPYISTGSLYLCAVGLLPLGLPVSDPFWSAPAEQWTAQKAWSGQTFPIDRAISV